MKWHRRWLGASATDRGPEERAADEALRERARALPREVSPDRDLWLGIRHRIEQEPAPAPPLWRTRLQLPVWAASAAALALVVVALGTGLWLGDSPSLDDPAEVRAYADALRQRDGMGELRRDLLTLLETRRDRLPPDVIATVETNLVEIDRAIAEIHLAFEDHPDNAALRFLLAEAYHREAQMLEQLEGWTRERPEEARS